MRSVRLLCTLVAGAVLAVAAPAAAEDYEARSLLKDEVARAAAKSDVKVRVPATISLDFDGQVFGSVSASRRSWSLGLDGAQDCGGANACFLASFSGEQGGTPAFRRTVRLTRGITGYYKPLSCGGSCSPAMIQWKQGGALYAIQAKVGVSGAAKQKAAMVAAANSAIVAPPR